MKLGAPGSGGNTTPSRMSRFTRAGLSREVMVVPLVMFRTFRMFSFCTMYNAKQMWCTLPHNTPSTHKVEEKGSQFFNPTYVLIIIQWCKVGKSNMSKTWALFEFNNKNNHFMLLKFEINATCCPTSSQHNLTWFWYHMNSLFSGGGRLWIWILQFPLNFPNLSQIEPMAGVN